MPSILGPKSSSYRIFVADMTCGHCVARVEKAALTVTGVESAMVDLEAAFVDVIGGLPHQVIEAISGAGYPAKPIADTPNNCPIPNSTQEKSNAPLTFDAKDQTNSYQISISDMTCSACVAAVEKAILGVNGVSQGMVNLIEKRAWVEGGEPHTVVNAIIDHGYSASLVRKQAMSDELTLCFNEPINDDLNSLLSRMTSKLEVNGQNAKLKTQCHPAELLIKLRDNGYDAHIKEQFEDPHIKQAEETRLEIKRSWQRASLAAGAGVFLMAGDMLNLLPHLSVNNGQFFWGMMALVTLFVMWFSGKNYYITAIKQAKHLSSNMDTLVALGTSAAWLSSVIVIIDPEFIPGDGNHLYLDASVLILAFLQLGHALEARAKRITSDAIGALVNLAPKSASVIYNESDVSIPVSLLRLNDRVRIKPGERVPIDGDVVSGSSSIDESMLTGEPVAVSKTLGDEVIGGTNNRNGSLIIKVTRFGADTTLANIISVVQKAQLSKPPIAKFVDKISAVFVPIVILIAITTFISWYLFGPIPPLAFAFTTGIAVLVIACPCALGLATPIATMMGTGRAAQLGILIKNSDALQSASSLTHLVVDKTGTLTEGKPSVTDIYNINAENDDSLLQIAMSLEIHSEHPLAEAVVDSGKTKALSPLSCEDFNSITGLGINAVINNQRYFLGNEKLMAQQNISIDPKWLSIAQQHAAQGSTPIWLASSSKLLGILILKDKIRADSAAAINDLHQQGIQVVMCTGDNKDTANAVAKELNISTVHSELLPEEKLQVIAALQAKGFKVGMVGDGVNDAPALAQANTGFAIGSGTDIAIEHADVTLVGNSLTNVSTAIAISSATIRNIKQNLFGAFIYNVIGIPLAAGLFYPITGWLLNPMFASFAMAMSSVTVVTNANRLRFFKPKIFNSSGVINTTKNTATPLLSTSSPQSGEITMSDTIHLKITGMSCGHCQKNATKALEAVAGVESVEVNLEPGGAVITGTANSDSLIIAVVEAGYEAELT